MPRPPEFDNFESIFNFININLAKQRFQEHPELIEPAFRIFSRILIYTEAGQYDKNTIDKINQYNHKLITSEEMSAVKRELRKTGRDLNPIAQI